MSLQQTEILESLSKYSITQPRETAKLPYYQLPFARNPNFFGRADVIQSINDALQGIDNDGQGQLIRSVALWGTGGIGKSQIALEYANLQVLNKCQLVLWLPTQTEIDLSRALVHAANEIRPAWYEDGMPTERVRFLMWNWLQTTGKCATPSIYCPTCANNGQRNIMDNHLRQRRRQQPPDLQLARRRKRANRRNLSQRARRRLSRRNSCRNYPLHKGRRRRAAHEAFRKTEYQAPR